MRKIVALLLVLLVISSMPVCAIAFGAPGYGDAESGDSGPAVGAGKKKDFMVPETTDTSWQTEETTIPAEEPTEISVTPDAAEVEAASSQETVLALTCRQKRWRNIQKKALESACSFRKRNRRNSGS